MKIITEEEGKKDIEPKIDATERAEFYSEKGVPFAVETFSKYAGIVEDDANKLLAIAHKNASSQSMDIASNRPSNIDWGPTYSRQLFTESDDQTLRNAIGAMARGAGREGYADVFFGQTLSALRIKVAKINARELLTAKAHNGIATYLEQNLSPK